MEHLLCGYAVFPIAVTVVVRLIGVAAALIGIGIRRWRHRR